MLNAVALLELPGTRAYAPPGARVCVAACSALATLKLIAARSLSAIATPPTLEEVRADATRRAIEAALQRCQGRLVDAARELDVSRVTLYRLMVRYGLRGSKPF